jgi:acyl dehydratase
MMMKRFSSADQEQFAELSGDWNPIHMDPVFARRTIAGKPVVHGIHLLMRALEITAELGLARGPVAALRVRFSAFVGLEQEVALRVVRDDDTELALQITANDSIRTEIALKWGVAYPAAHMLEAGHDPVEPGRTALAWVSDEGDAPKGLIRAIASRETWADAFPRAAQWIGAERLAALGASTRLVGMVCPGLHSVYLGLSIRFVDDDDGDAPLAFVMGKPRHGLIQGKVAGGGVEGTLECLQRAAPHIQPSSTDLAGLVGHQDFAGDRVLIVGGSRGLGEICAKILAIGGAAISITYAAGEGEAQRVAEDIRAASGTCDVLRHRVGDDCGMLLDALGAPPTHAYYFATPQIAQPDSRFFDGQRFERMRVFYVDGFWSLAAEIHSRRQNARLFYPSSVFVSDRPAGYGEYAMAKAAGEMLCAEINNSFGPMEVIVERLPQLTTDQTLTSFGARGDDPVEVLLPIIRNVQARG